MNLYILILSAVAWTVVVFAAGAIYGSLKSIRVGEKINYVLLKWDELVDKYHWLDRRTRNKLAKAKRIAKL